MSKDFKLPDLGEGVHEGQIVRVLVKPGDVVREDQPLMEVETDKAAVEIPCPFSGVVEKVHVTAGQLVHVGDVMVTFGEGIAVKTSSGSGGSQKTDAEIKPVGSRSSSAQPSNHPALPAKPSSGTGAGVAVLTPTMRRHAPASPAVRKLARTMGVDINAIHGSGPGGRVQRADVEACAGRTDSASPAREGGGSTRPQVEIPPAPLHAKTLIPRGAIAAKVAYSALPESLVVEPPPGVEEETPHGRIRRVPLTQARKTIAKVMAQSWSTIPHATDCDDADVTELEKLRKGYSPPDGSDRKLTMLAFVIRAVVRALQRFPDFNAHFDAEKEQVVYHRAINIAVGVHTERGLIAPVLRHADGMSIPQISDELEVMAEKARTAGFAVNDTRGGTYTISNAGAMGGSRYSTPIITPGQAAVLAVGRTRWMPWVIEGESPAQPRGIAPRLIMPLSQSIDHRLLDGGGEIAFMQQVIGDLQNPARLLL